MGVLTEDRIQYQDGILSIWDGGTWVPWAGKIPWIPFSYLNGWSDYAVGYFKGGYRKIHGETVQIRGLVKNTAGVAANLPIASALPTSYRPQADFIFTNYSSQFYTTTAGGFDLRVLTTGSLVVLAPAVTAGQWIALNVEYSTTGI